MKVTYIDCRKEYSVYNEDAVMITALRYIYPRLRTWSSRDWRNNTLLAVF